MISREVLEGFTFRSVDISPSCPKEIIELKLMLHLQSFKWETLQSALDGIAHVTANISGWECAYWCMLCVYVCK